MYATDASAEQIENAPSHPKVEYSVASASASGLKDQSVGLVTVAQALHWFPAEAFRREVERVLVPGGWVVAWCYELFAISPEVDDVVKRLYDGILQEDWSPERRHVETGYDTYPWPWTKSQTPEFVMNAMWSREDVLGYLGTWSASRKYRRRTGQDAVALIEPALRAAWPEGGRREVRWPMPVVASRWSGS